MRSIALRLKIESNFWLRGLLYFEGARSMARLEMARQVLKKSFDLDKIMAHKAVVNVPLSYWHVSCKVAEFKRFY